MPTKPLVVFGHHFSSIAGAGPVNGPIIAAIFGWVPVVLWLLFGSIFMGAVQDFGAMLASVRNEGKSIGYLVEKYLGKSGKLIFLIFVYMLLLLVVAAFADIVAKTFSAGVNIADTIGGSTATSSILFIIVSMFFGYSVYVRRLPLFQSTIVGLIFIVFSIYLGYLFPTHLDKNTWLVLIMGYVFVASATPIWFILQPRDYLSSFFLYAMIIASVIGILLVNPTINLPMFTGFVVDGKYLFPILFVTVACGAISGFHSLIASGSVSKQLSDVKYSKPIGYGGMILEAFLAVIAVIAVGSLFVDKMPVGAPPVIFASSMANTISVLGIPTPIVYLLMTLTLSAFELTTLDSAARIGRLTICELIISSKDDTHNLPRYKKVLTNHYVSTLFALVPAYLLARLGYENIWPLFGSANQLMAAMALLAIALWLKNSKLNNKMVIAPMIFMNLVTLSALLLIAYKDTVIILNGDFDIFREGIQVLFSLTFVAMAVILLVKSIKKLRE